MSYLAFHKVKSAGKRVTPKGQKLEELVLSTLKLAADVVGATLGPGGCPVLIERQEHAMPPIITKDGVTVFRALGFEDSTKQVVLEAARDAAVRTASEAGDGTTTATILAHSIALRTSAYVRANPTHSPQRVMRQLERVFREDIEPTVRAAAIPVDGGVGQTASELLFSVAKTSANGDAELADKVLECHDLVGDSGNVTIVEVTGPSSYEVEPIEGYSVGSGYEDSCARFFQKFINDPANQRCFMPNPAFLLYHGKVTDVQSLVPIIEMVFQEWQSKGFAHNIVLVATGFSESVLGNLAFNFAEMTTVNIFPLLAPATVDPNGQLNFLQDLAVMTGTRVLDPMNNPLDRATLDDLGQGPGLTGFESTRFRSTVIGHVKTQKVEEDIQLRAEEIQGVINHPASELDKILAQERLGKLTGGIARLKVYGLSNGETKEKRDRAEDAICAVRGAIRHGVLPGGGWTLLRVIAKLSEKYPQDAVVQQVLLPALREPVERLLTNCGHAPAELAAIIDPVASAAKDGVPLVYDAMNGAHVDALEAGVLDSTPAVLEAIRNSLSIASLLGTLGGTVVFVRDENLERLEAREQNAFNQQAEVNAADERP